MAKGGGGGGPTVAKAYVAIIPTTRDAQKNISKSLIPELDAAGKEGGEKLSGGLTSSLKSGASKIASIAKAAIAGAGVAAITKFVHDSVGAFSEFEQLSGGVQKIFDELDTSKIIADAKAAYDTLGLSANQYLEAMTGVGATLASTLGDEKGYETAKMGMSALADLSSGTGKSMDVLMEKYQLITRTSTQYLSIADQFAGVLPQTNQGFLDAAYGAGYLTERYKEMKDVPLAEYQMAVTNMIRDGVEQMGFLGNASHEAYTTLAGSAAMMKSAWSNLVLAFGTGSSSEIETSLQAMGTSLMAYLKNLLPRIGLILSGIVSSIPTIAQDIIAALPGMVSDISGAFVEQVGTIDLGAMLKPVIDIAMENSLVASIVSFGGRIGEAFTQVFGEVDLAATFDTIRVAVETAMGVITQVITTAQDTLASFLGSIDTATIVAIMEGLKQIGEALIGALMTLGGIVADVLVGLVWPTLQGIWGFVSGIILPGIMSLWETIQPGIIMVIGMLGQVYDWISQLVSGLIEFLVPAIALILEIAAPVIQGLMDGIGEILGTLISSIGAMWDTIAPFVSRVVADLSAFFSELGKWIRAVWPVVSWVANQIGQIIAVVVRTVTSMVSGLISGIGNIIKGIIGVVTGIASTIYDLITGNFDALQSDFSGLVSSIGDIFWGVIEIITSPFRYAFSQIRSLWNSTVGSLHFSVPDWVPGIGGKSFGMPQLASGGTIMQAGSVMVGEAGPEILTLPRGARVTPLRDADTSAGATYSVIVGDVDLTDDDQVRRVTREYLAFLATLAKPSGIVAV